MTRPRALDLFCCAGGCTKGLEAAGFDVIGIDWKPSQHWTGHGELHQADLSTAEAVEAIIRAFAPDLVSASPPCQRYSSATPSSALHRHADLLDSTRRGICAAGVPGWIENVPGAPLEASVLLCGSMFEKTLGVRRHRLFELIGWWTLEPHHGTCTRGRSVVTIAGNGGHGPGQKHGQNSTGPECIRWREALGWIDGPRDRYSLAQAIPPAYAEWLGRRFLESRRDPE